LLTTCDFGVTVCILLNETRAVSNCRVAQNPNLAMATIKDEYAHWRHKNNEALDRIALLGMNQSYLYVNGVDD
jgi:hypothetical protein